MSTKKELLMLQRRWSAGLVVAFLLVAACGGSESSDQVQMNAVPSPDTLGATEARKGGGGGGGGGSTVTQSGSIVVPPVSYGGSAWVSYYPGSYANDKLELQLNCKASGVDQGTVTTWELHYAVQNNMGGYAWVTDHWVVYFGPFSGWVGTATCTVKALDLSKNLASVASTSFTVSQ